MIGVRINYDKNRTSYVARLECRAFVWEHQRSAGLGGSAPRAKVKIVDRWFLIAFSHRQLPRQHVGETLMVLQLQQLMAAAPCAGRRRWQKSFAALRECIPKFSVVTRFPSFGRAGHQNHLRRTFRLREHKRGTDERYDRPS